MNNKKKRTDYKKILVRNVEQPIPKQIITPVASDIHEKKAQMPAAQDTEQRLVSQSKSTSKIAAPELQSTLKLSKRIDEITLNPRKTKSLSDVDRNKMMTSDEKVSRKVNFPYDQAVYKGLIPLSCHSTKSQTQQSYPILRGPATVQKDKEPVLSDFIEPRKKQNYYYLPKVKIDNSPFITSSSSSNLKLYSLLQVNEIQ